jgi:hypothetical protein
MFSAPPVLVEPKDMIADEASLITRERFEWATQTPEPSPICLLKVPLHPSDEYVCSFKTACSPAWEEMLTRVATHADILGAAEPTVRHLLIETLCKPFFDQAVETLCKEISSVGPAVVGATWQKTMDGPLKDDRTTLSLGRCLGLLEEDSTDADNDSAFTALFSSDGEDCEVEPRMEWTSHSSHFSVDGDSESPKDDDDDAKSQMVCRHWKSKGWCRYQSQCKFLHPPNKQGISAKDPTGNCCISLPNRSTRRGGKNKRNMVALDSRLFFADSCNMCPPFATCQGAQELHFGSYQH